MFTLEDVVAIAKPHNDKIVAEHRLAEAEATILRLHGQIFDLKSTLGGLTALMLDDVACEKVPATPTRLDLLTKAKELAHVR